MRLPITPPRTEPRSKPVHFQYTGTEKGQPWEAYIAGPTWWGYLHMLRPSKPCVYELTGTKVPCRFCRRGPDPVIKGWVPLYRQVDGQASCVPVDEAMRDVLDKLRTFTRVIVGRAKDKGSSVWVRMATNQEPAYKSTLPERKGPADISQSLLAMWDLPEVWQFFRGQIGSDNALSLPEGTAVTDSGEPFSPMMQSAAKRAGADVVPTAAEESDAAAERDYLRGVQAGTIKPSTNGHHKKKR